MEERDYPQAPDRPMSQLDELYQELARVHDLISTLDGRLSPVSHHGLKNSEKALAAGSTTAAQQNHISTAVQAANAAGNRIREIIDSLAV